LAVQFFSTDWALVAKKLFRLAVQFFSTDWALVAKKTIPVSGTVFSIPTVDGWTEDK
jgi:hypothetical protein